MTNLRLTALVVALAATACGPEGPFDHVAMQRTPGMGYCVEAGTWSTVTLDRRDDGTYDASGSAIRVANPPVDPCLSEESGTCLVAEAVEPFVLTAAQSTELNDLLEAIPQRTCTPDEGLECDPCVVTSLTYDDQETHGDCCGDWLHDADAAISAVIAFLDGLVPG